MSIETSYGCHCCSEAVTSGQSNDRGKAGAMNKRLLVFVSLFSILTALLCTIRSRRRPKERARQKGSQSKVVVTANTTTTAAAPAQTGGACDWRLQSPRDQPTTKAAMKILACGFQQLAITRSARNNAWSFWI
jgi:hypothetical protein